MYRADHMDRLMLAADQHTKEKEYWWQRLAGFTEKTWFPYDHKKTGIGEACFQEMKIEFNPEVTSRLIELSKGSDHALHIIFAAGVTVLLAKYTGNPDIIIGTPVYEPRIEKKFINTILTLRSQSKARMTFKDLLIDLRQEVLEASENQNFPVEILIEQLGLEFTGVDFPLFDVIVLLENLHNPKYIQHIPVNMVFSFKREARRIAGTAIYNSRLYEKQTVERIIGRFIDYLQVSSLNLSHPIAETDLLSIEEKNRILYDFNRTETVYPACITIHELFWRQAGKYPHHTAVTGPDESECITFGELDERAGSLGVRLRQKGVKAGVLVAIMVERSLETVIGILGVLKAGGAYLPIDPGYPRDRIHFVLSDCSTGILLSRQEYFEEIGPGFEGTKLRLEDKTLYGKKHGIPDNPAKPRDPVYVIYTSGSTGRPKGVMIQHHSLVNRLKWMQKQFPLGKEDTILHKTPFTFDVSVWEIFWWAIVGAKVRLLVHGGEREPSAIVDAIEKSNVTVIHFVPSMLNAFLEYIKSLVYMQIGRLSPLKQVIASGEVLTPAQVNLFKELLGKNNGTRLANLYGPTEATIDVSFFDCSSQEELKMIPIGKPIDNIQLGVVNKDNRLQPIGLPGELCISGVGLARGYLNNPELTAQKFQVPNPIFQKNFVSSPHSTYLPYSPLYRTGDLAKWLPDGNLEYIGREDNQVKIRGFRIELGEIENQLLLLEEVKEAVVEIKGEAEEKKYLCGYVVTYREFPALELQEYLIKALQQRLPGYMIPTYFITLEQIPLAPNGKMDRKQLPEPEIISEGDYTAPGNEVEKQLIRIWQQVLDIKRIGITDNFFRIGGDSIVAIKLISVINNQFGINLKIGDIYRYQTIEAIAAQFDKIRTNRQNESRYKEALSEIEEFKKQVTKSISNRKIPGDIEDIYPMSDIEKGMIFYSIKNDADALYYDQAIIQTAFDDFDIERMKKALALLVEKHPTLRTAFLIEQFAHIIYKYDESFMNHLIYHDISSMERTAQENHIKKYMLDNRNNPFNLLEAPLWRIAFFKTSTGNIVLLWEVHHTVIDGWSYASFLTELNNTYHRLQSESNFVPERLKCSYKHFIIDHTAEKKNKAARNFWRNELMDYKRWDLPKSLQKKELKRLYKNMGHDLREKLESVSMGYNISLKHLCLAAYFYTLYMFSYENDITAGLVTHVRPECEDGDKLLGCFLNTVPIRIIIPPHVTWKKYIELIDKKAVELKKHDKLSLLEIVKIIEEKAGDRNPIFDSIFNYIDFHVFKEAKVEEPQTNNMDIFELENYEMTNYHLEIMVNTLEGGFFLTFKYSTEFLNDYMVEKVYRYFFEFLNKFVGNSTGEIEKKGILPEEERRKLLYDFNATVSEYPGEKTIHEFFEEQVEHTPDYIAVVGSSAGEAVSYRELDEKSNRLACLLRSKGVTSDTIVGIMVERSIEMMIGILGILKAGGVYLPIDPDYPQERIRYMLKDSGAKVLLASSETRVKVEAEVEESFGQPRWLSLQFINITTSLESAWEPSPSTLTSTCQVSSTNLAYVIYTSGSTGKPKGVLIRHHSVINRLNWMQGVYPIGTQDVILQKTSYTFDVSVWELFWWFFEGACVCLLGPGEEKNPQAIIEAVEKYKVTTMHFVPSMLSVFLEYLPASSEDNQKKLSSLKQVIASGEALSLHLVKRFEERLYKENRTKLANLYGPTEATVDVSYYNCFEENDLETIPIGKPIDNIQLYVMDRNTNLQPVGIAGELCIAGDGLARGYLNNPELTAEKFIFSPFPHFPLYRTGDLARWLPCGNLEFLRRIDHQVKIRGFRIESGEIENRLLNIGGIKEAVVLPIEEESGNKYMCAYFVSDREYGISEIREYLAKELPDYMIPSYFVKMEKIPLTPNGKINRGALPAPEEISLREDVGYTLPSSPVEKKLVEIWEKVLGRNNIGINENFFFIGGDSIKSIQIISRMSSAGYKLEMKDLFQYPVISDLAPKVKKVKRIPDQSVVTGTIPLTPIQGDFFNKSHIDFFHYNQAVILYSREGFDKGVLKEVFSKIQEHHDALRMTYKLNIENGKIVQTNHGLDYPLSIDEYDLKNRQDSLEELNAKSNEIQASIDLEKGPLMKLGLFHLDDGDRLLIAINHLVIDGVSWRILFEDIETLYHQYKGREKLVLPSKTDSFKLWSEKLSAYANSKTFLKEKTYWQKLESVEAPPIPKDFDTDDNYFKDTVSVSFTLREEESRLLLTEVNEIFRTEVNDILLTALGMAIKKTFGHPESGLSFNRVLIALEGHGREEIPGDIDISRTVGWFTSLYPVLMNISYSSDPGRQIKEIKDTLRRIPNKGLGYGILKYLTGEENKKEIEFKSKPPMSFNYLGQFDADVKQKSFFEIAKESAGNSQSPNNRREYLLDVSGMTANNRLSMTISYNKTHFRPETMAQLIGNFESELKHIIKFCCSRKDIEHTPSDFTYKGLSIESIDRLMKEYPGIEDIYTLTPMQEGMLFHSLLDEASSSYFERMSYRLQGELEISLVEKSLNELFKRHDILRTSFLYKGIERPVQAVLRARAVDFYYEDIRQIGEREEKENFIKEFKEKDKDRSFDLRKDVLMRVVIFLVDELEYEFTWSFHHILMDGWCIGILNSEFFEIYSSYLDNRPYRLPALKPYRRYIQWLEKQDTEESSRYWKNYLDSYEEKTGVPKTKISKEGNEPVYRNERVSLVLDMEKTARLNKVAAGNHVTLNTVTQTLWGVLLGKYNGREDVVFGAVVSGRPFELEGVESMVGLFINTIPVRIRFEERMKFYQLLQIVQEEAIASEPHHYHPLAEIQSSSTLKQNLMDHILVFENYPITEQVEGYGRERNTSNKLALKLANVEVFEQTNYDFNVVFAGSDQLRIIFQYNGNVYDKEFVERIANHFILVFDQVIESQELEIRDLTILSDEEKSRILYEFNNTIRNDVINKTIVHMIEEQVEKVSDNAAIIFKNEIMTYRELNGKANGLAYILLKKGVKKGKYIPLLMKQSFEFPVALLAVLKTGAALVPMDMKWPPIRINKILRDLNCEIVLINNDMRDLNLNIRNEFEMVEIENSLIYPQAENLEISIHPEDSVYAIYTSGSTGEPKGAINIHKGITNKTLFMNKIYACNTDDIYLMTGNIAFDSSFAALSWSLCSDSILVLPSPNIRVGIDLENIIALIQEKKVTIIGFVPSLFNILVDQIVTRPETIEKLKTLRLILIGGEEINPKSIQKFKSYFPKIRIFNTYGPSETSIAAIYYEIFTLTDAPIPIGKPIDNIYALILNKSYNIVSVGVSGELYIGGHCVGLGYLNKVEKTADVFINSPNKNFDKGVFYKTGDLARWLYDGNIEFLGRIDHQVKIRGNRIELGEIVKRLLNYPGIKEAVVLAREEEKGDKYLCAYIVSDSEIVMSELRELLSKELPDYMIPAYFVELEKIPLTPNGKVDRKALPRPEFKAGEGYAAPGTETEKKLVELWAEVLNIKKEVIGIGSNFFELGGHSLKATILVSNIHKVFDVKIPLVEVFKTPTIRGLSRYIESTKISKYAAIEPTEKREYYTTSSAQKRLYFFQKMNPESTVYNIPEVIHLAHGMDKGRVEQVLKKLILRHETFRTSFGMIEGDVVQWIHDDVEFEIEPIKNVTCEAIKPMEPLPNTNVSLLPYIRNLIRPFDLSKAPLLRAGFIPAEKGKQILVIDIHHITSDGYSREILLEDFMRLDEGIGLPPLKIQYKEFAQWQNRWLKSEKKEKQMNFWLDKLSGELPELNIPTDFPRLPLQSFEGDSISFTIDKDLRNQIRELEIRTGATLFMILLAAFYILLSRYTGQEDIRVGFPIAGRHHADLFGVVGMFVNLLVLRNRPEGEKIFMEFLNEVNESSIQAFENQDVQFEELVDRLKLQTDPSRNPLFDVCIFLQNFRDKQGKIETIKSDRESINKISHFDLELGIYEMTDGIYYSLGYSTQLFKKSTAENIAKRYVQILKQVVNNPGIKIKNIKLTHTFAILRTNILLDDDGDFGI